MPRRGENIYKRKDGRWEGRYMKARIDGKIKYGYVFAKTYKEVKGRLASINSSCTQTDMDSPVFHDNVSDEYFSKTAEEWFGTQKPQWKNSSVIKYMNILNTYLLPEFSGRKMSEITRNDVVIFSNRLLAEGGVNKEGLSPKTVSDIISVMKNIFKYASQIKDIHVADIKGITVKQSPNPMRIFSRAEQKRLSDYLYSDLNLCNLGILVCLYTGLRVGEICALKWGDISFDERYLYVHQTMQRLQTKEEGKRRTIVVISAPKSDCSIRRVPIPTELFQLLRDARCQDDAFLLTGRTCDYVEPRTMQNRFKAAVRQCNIKDANFHALRHTFATRCVELGFDMKSLSEILGHASVNITLNRYVHPSMELKQRNMDMLSELFSVK